MRRTRSLTKTMIRQAHHKKTNNAKDMDAKENIVERLKQWMADEGISSPRSMVRARRSTSTRCGAVRCRRRR